MTEQNSEPASDRHTSKEAERPQTLSGLLGDKDAKVATYFDDLKHGRIALPETHDLESALARVKADVGLLGRVAEIARHAAELDHARFPKFFLDWCTNALRASDESLGDWMRMSGHDPHGQLKHLAGRMHAAKDKAEKAPAEACLTIGMCVLMRQFGLEPEDALRAVASTLNKSNERPAIQQNREKDRLGRVLRRAGAVPLTNLATVVRLLDATVVDARQRMSEAVSARQELFDKNLKLKGDLDRSAQHVAQLSNECEQLKQQIINLRAEIDGVKGEADHGEIELKARYRTMLMRRLRPYLSDAAEALQADPPYPDVAGERVRLGLAEIAKEQEWLDRS